MKKNRSLVKPEKWAAHAVGAGARTPDDVTGIEYSWQSTPQLWLATWDNYDGAIDSKHPFGIGRTKEEAAADLIAQADGRGGKFGDSGQDADGFRSEDDGYVE